MLDRYPMHPNSKKDAQKAEDAGLMALPLESAPVARTDAPGEEGIENSEQRDVELREKDEPEMGAPAETRSGARPRQDSLDRQRATDEGMTPPSSP